MLHPPEFFAARKHAPENAGGWKTCGLPFQIWDPWKYSEGFAACFGGGYRLDTCKYMRYM